jgi:prepilin-type processing-associated H-X9-DG protein
LFRWWNDFIDSGRVGELTHLELRVLLKLVRHADNNTGETRPGVPSIGRAAACQCLSRVRSALRSLSEKGFIQTLVESAGGRPGPESTTVRRVIFDGGSLSSSVPPVPPATGDRQRTDGGPRRRRTGDRRERDGGSGRSPELSSPTLKENSHPEDPGAGDSGDVLDESGGNLRQIATAWVAYCHVNSGLLPAAAEGGVGRRHDFLVWWSPITQEQLDRSALAPYLGIPLNPMIFRCPSDDWEVRSFVPSGFGPYQFSYSMNVMISNTWQYSPFPIKIKLWRVRNPPHKIVMIEEDERFISDGIFFPRKLMPLGKLDEIAARHQRDRGPITGTFTVDPIDAQKWANAFFADGHVEYVNGTYAYDRKHLLPDE